MDLIIPRSRTVSRRAWWIVPAAVGVILLAVALRLHALDCQSLWNDEGSSVGMIGRTWADIATNAAADIHPPGYYWMLKAWAAFAGDSELALRAFSALASVLTVALVFALGRRLFGARAGLIAALLLACHSFAVYYAQETRMYALLALWSAAGLWALTRWLLAEEKRIPSPQRARRTQSQSLFFSALSASSVVKALLLLALINAAGLYTQYAYPFSMIAQGVIFLVWWLQRRDGRTLARYVGANLLTLILFAPWAGTAIRQVTAWPNTGMGTPLAAILETVAFGLPVESAANWGWGVAAGLLLILGALLAASVGRSRAVIVPLAWLIVPVGAFALLRMSPDDVKSLLPAASAAALIVGAGVSSLLDSARGSLRALPAAVLVMGIILLAFVRLPEAYAGGAYERDDYRAIAARILAEARPASAVILDGPGQGEVWAYYDPGLPAYPLPHGLGGDDDGTRAEVDRLLRAYRRLYVLFWGEGERDPNRVVESALDARAFEVESRWYGDVRFVVYAVPGEAASEPSERLDVPFGDHITLEGYALDGQAHAPGDVLTLTLFWRTDTALSVRYKVFVHLYADPDAPPLAQHDAEPGGGLIGTTDWQPGETVVDRHGIALPPDLPPGDYTLAVGIYDAADPLARLSSPQGDRLPLATVRVRP